MKVLQLCLLVGLAIAVHTEQFPDLTMEDEALPCRKRRVSTFCSGWVTHEADILKASPPNCFRVNQTNTGIYFIAFNPPLRGLPVCIANQIYPGSYDSHGNTRDNAVIMNADQRRMAYVSGDQFGNPSNRNVTFICIA
jgi:hypothetical protein